MLLYVVYGSISAPIRNSPRSVCETYTCSWPETMTTFRNGLSGSVTKAWRMWVVIGSRMSASPATSDDQPAVALTTCPHSTRPRVVSTAVIRSPSRSRPVTSVYGWISTPSRSAPRANAQTTASWRMIPPGGW